MLGQKKYAEAGPLLLAGYEGMKQRISKIPPNGKTPRHYFEKVRQSEALDRLIKVAEATGKPDEAKAWREVKARITTPTAPVLPSKPEAGKP